jgi:phenylacetate-CoA ligase
MQVVADDDQNLQLTIAVELAPLTPAPMRDRTLADAVAGSILTHLRRLDPEFAAYVPEERQRPRVTLHPAGDPEYFPVGVKHRYSRT